MSTCPRYGACNFSRNSGDGSLRVRLCTGRCLRRAPSRRQCPRHLHRRPRSLPATRCKPSPARPISARPPSFSLATPRSNASTACRSASSPYRKNCPSPATPRSVLRAGSIGTIQSCVAQRRSRSIFASVPSPCASSRRRPASTASSAPCGRTIPIFGELTHEAATRSPRLSISPSMISIPSFRRRPSRPAWPSASCRCVRLMSRHACKSRPRSLAVPRPQRRKILSLHHPRRCRLSSRLARTHAVLQRRRSRHRLCFRLHHRLSRASRPRRKRSDRSSSNRVSRCFVPAAFTSAPQLADGSVTNVFVGGRTIPVASGRFFLP